MSDRTDFVILAAPWSKHSVEFRATTARSAGDIHTYDGGHLRLVDGLWQVVFSGDANDADMVLNALRKPN